MVHVCFEIIRKYNANRFWPKSLQVQCSSVEQTYFSHVQILFFHEMFGREKLTS